MFDVIGVSKAAIFKSTGGISGGKYEGLPLIKNVIWLQRSLDVAHKPSGQCLYGKQKTATGE